MSNADTYLLVVAILEGRNFDRCKVSPSPYSSSSTVDAQTVPQVLLLEARFADEVLVSDPVPFKNSCPKTLTELAWEINRKGLHDFRIERKPIKLQVFSVDSNGFKQLIGYHIFDIRSAQETTSPSYQWKPLLNSKYKGLSTERPEVLCAVRLIRSEDDIVLSEVNGQEKSLIYAESNGESINGHEEHLDNDLQVKETGGMFKIWDSRSFQESDCHKKYMFSVVIATANDLIYLVPNTEQSEDQEYYFQYNLLGTTIKTGCFMDLQSCSFPMEKVTFRICVPSVSTLKSYFALNPNLEILLKKKSESHDQYDQIIGTSSVFLRNLIKDNGIKDRLPCIAGEFSLTPVDEYSVSLEGDSQPRVGLYIDLEEISSETSSEENSVAKLNDTESPLIHFSMSVDIRSLYLFSSSGRFFIQYSYPIFGTTKTVKTEVVNINAPATEVTFSEGYFSFNFASTSSVLREAFLRAPLVMELMEKTSSGKNIVKGICRIDLTQVFDSKSDLEKKRILVSKTDFRDANDQELGTLKVILCLKEMDTLLDSSAIIPPSLDLSSLDGSHDSTNANTSQTEVLQKLLVEAAVEVEIWKQQQKKKIRQRLTDMSKHQSSNNQVDKNNSLKEMERELKESLDRIRRQETDLKKREKELQEMDSVYKNRFDKLNEEISVAIQELKDAYEDRLEKERKSNEELEAENRQLIHEITSLKLSNVKGVTSNNISSQGKTSLYGRPSARTQSLVRTNSVPSSVRSASLRTRTPSITKTDIPSTTSGLRPPVTRDLRARTPSVGPRRPPAAPSSSLSRATNGSTAGSRTSLTRLNGVTSVSEKKTGVLRELKNERDSLIKKGLCRSDDPMIKSIEKELRRNGMTTK